MQCRVRPQLRQRSLRPCIVLSLRPRPQSAGQLKQPLVLRLPITPRSWQRRQRPRLLACSGRRSGTPPARQPQHTPYRLLHQPPAPPRCLHQRPQLDRLLRSRISTLSNYRSCRQQQLRNATHSSRSISPGAQRLSKPQLLPHVYQQPVPCVRASAFVQPQQLLGASHGQLRPSEPATIVFRIGLTVT